MPAPVTAPPFYRPVSLSGAGSTEIAAGVDHPARPRAASGQARGMQVWSNESLSVAAPEALHFFQLETQHAPNHPSVARKHVA